MVNSVLGLGNSGASSATSDTSQSAQSLDKKNKQMNQFLKLLVTQLRNQDPLKPMDANQFTSQLVQFASVEQQIYQNANLEKLVSIQQTSQVASMVGYLGNDIEAKGQNFNLDGGKAKFTYALDKKPTETTITISDKTGKTVWSGTGSRDTGKHTFDWDGKDSLGNVVPDGPYKVVVSAKNSTGDLQDVTQTIFGRVTGAGADKGKVILSLGDVPIKLEDILSVQKPPVV